jgi:uncharacterized protein with von Willebrand factor type A (vWA) domain
MNRTTNLYPDHCPSGELLLGNPKFRASVARVWTEPGRDATRPHLVRPDPDLIDELTSFTFALRLAGLAVTIDQSMCFLRAVDSMECPDVAALHAAGRLHLCSDHHDYDIFDRAFNGFVQCLHLDGIGAASFSATLTSSLLEVDGDGRVAQLPAIEPRRVRRA